MSDTAESKKLLFQYTKARIPFIVVNTIEKDRALEILKSVSDEMQLPFCVSSLSKGIYDLASNRTIEDDPTFSIYADETVPVKEVVALMNIAKRNHYKVIMATSPE